MTSSSSQKLLREALVLVAPSGAGKSTLLKRLEQVMPGRFGYSISHTTREPRVGEVNGVHYHFITETEFKKMIENNEFLEYAIVHKTTYYGTSFKALEDVAKQNKVAAMDLDIVGACSMRKSHIPSCIVFIEVPSLEVLEQRLRDRATESEDKIQIRMESARKEMAWYLENKEFFDIQLLNDDFEECFSKFRREVGRIIFGEVESPEATKTQIAADETNNKDASSTTTTAQQSRDASTVPASQKSSTERSTKEDEEEQNVDLSAEKKQQRLSLGEEEKKSTVVSQELKF